MKKIYLTSGGEHVDFSWLTWEFIKSMDKTKEFELFKSALVDKEIDVFS